MSKPRPRTRQIHDALMEQVFWRSRSPVRVVAHQFGLTRQAVQQHAQELVRIGSLTARGTARWRIYRLARLEDERVTFALGKGLTEDDVWERFARPFVSALGREESGVLHYGLTEMVNNVIDHSGGSKLAVRYWRTPISITFRVTDNGVGIFQKIARQLHLHDARQALLELGKGKFTTDPKRHTGEGIFFSSRAFDRFSLRSSNLLFTRSSKADAWRVSVEDKSTDGTRVTMSLLLPARRQLEAVFKRYSSGPEDYRFAKTHVPLKLATFGDETLVSRSSARRVLARVDCFDEVLLDFNKVDNIGPAFADEIFRVFAAQHSEVALIVINANEKVTAMIQRAKRHNGDDGLGTNQA